MALSAAERLERRKAPTTNPRFQTMPPDSPTPDLPTVTQEPFSVDIVAAGEVAHPGASNAGTRLPAGLAAAVRDIVASSTRVLDASSTDPLLVRLKPSAATAAGLESGALRLAPKGDGGALAQARNVKNGRIVEQIEIQPATSTAKTNVTRAAAGAAFAWQALAIATQQHYLVEISGSLGSIESAVKDLGMDLERDSEAFLEVLVGKLSRIETHIETGAPVAERDRGIADEGFSECEKVARARLKKIDALFADEAGRRTKSGSSTLARQIALTKRALAVMARCAWVATQMPDENAQRAVNDLQYYSARFDELREQANADVMRLDDIAQQADDAWERHELARAAMSSNVRKLKDPLKSLAAAPVVGDRYVSTRDAVRKVARRPNREAERAEFVAFSRRDLRAPRAMTRLPREERAIVSDWVEAIAPQSRIAQVEILVDGDDVRLLARSGHAGGRDPED